MSQLISAQYGKWESSNCQSTPGHGNRGVQALCGTAAASGRLHGLVSVYPGWYGMARVVWHGLVLPVMAWSYLSWPGPTCHGPTCPGTTCPGTTRLCWYYPSVLVLPVCAGPSWSELVRAGPGMIELVRA